MLKPFVINTHGSIVFPGNFFPELDFSVFKSLKQFAAVIRRDFGEKAPTDVEIAARVKAGEYKTRYELCRDLVLNRFWVNRYTLTMYEKRPTRWGDLPRLRDDVFLPVYKPRDSSAIATAMEAGYQDLPASWDEEMEDRSFAILLNVYKNALSSGGELRPIRPTVAEALADPANRTRQLQGYDPDYLRYTFDDVVDCLHPVPELEALMRQCMILHNQYPWDPSTSMQTEIGKLKDDDYVVAFHPRNEDVLRFIQRVKQDENWGPRIRPNRMIRPDTLALSQPIKPYPPVEVSKQFKVLPHFEAIAVYEGEVTCTNADLIRNHAYCWSRMSAAEISEKTGIEQRRYTQLPLEDMALLAAKKALAKSGRRPAEIGAVLFCTCTSTKLIPSVATWLSGELGLMQTHASCDIVAACAGMSYGLAETVRLLQEIERPVLLVCAEKFSDKIGTVRTSRMIFGDGAAAMIVAPAPEGTPSDIEYFQTYASGPWSEVNSIIWPNPEFDNNITVYGPEVKALVTRYLKEMMGELANLPNPNGGDGSLIDAIELVVPHQANKNMVLTLAEAAGIPGEHIFFNIERVGNTSSASILMAVHDAVREGRIDRPMRIFAPGFGAGAVGGYVVMRVDPAIVSVQFGRQEFRNGKRCRGKWKLPPDFAHRQGRTGDRGRARHWTRDRARTRTPRSKGSAEFPGGCQARRKCSRRDPRAGCRVPARPGRRRQERRGRAHRQRGARQMAAARHPGEQCRYHARSIDAQDDRRRLGRGNQRQPERHVLLHQRGGAGHDQPEVWPHHQHRLRCRADGSVWTGELFSQQGWHYRVHQNARPRDGEVQHHRQCDCAWLHVNGDG